MLMSPACTASKPDGKRVGDWKFWHDDGSIDEEQVGVYEDGVKIR